MAGESGLDYQEKTRPARIFSELSEILEGSEFEPGGNRSRRRKVEVASDNLTYKVTHTSYRGGRYGAQHINAYTVNILDKDNDEEAFFHYAATSFQLTVNRITTQDDEDWQSFEKVLGDIRTAQEQVVPPDEN